MSNGRIDTNKDFQDLGASLKGILTLTTVWSTSVNAFLAIPKPEGSRQIWILWGIYRLQLH